MKTIHKHRITFVTYPQICYHLTPERMQHRGRVWEYITHACSQNYSKGRYECVMLHIRWTDPIHKTCCYHGSTKVEIVVLEIHSHRRQAVAECIFCSMFMYTSSCSLYTSTSCIKQTYVTILSKLFSTRWVFSFLVSQMQMPSGFVQTPRYEFKS